MAKKKPSPSSPRKSGNAKPTKKREALDNSTNAAALEKAIERQRKAMETDDLEEDPYFVADISDPDCYVETLLNVPNRKPLDDPGSEVKSHNKLIRFVLDKPSLYKRFITSLKEGASLGSAAFSSGFCSALAINAWIKQGMQDEVDGKDSYYYRLYLDVARANATKRVEVEILVAETNPMAWLERGPGRYIDDQWKPTANVRAIGGVPQDALPAPEESPLRLAAKPVEVEEALEGEVVEEDNSEYEAALAILRESGQDISQQPESWMKALRIQAGEQLTDEELEVKEDEESPISLGSNEALLTEQARQAQSSLPS